MGKSIFKNDALALFLALQKEESQAILFVMSEILPTIRRLFHQYKIDCEDIGEIQDDTTLKLLQKIKSETFRFEGVSPIAYANTIAKNLILNKFKEIQRKKNKTVRIEEWTQLENEKPYGGLEEWESRMILSHFLKQMNPCRRKLFFLYYKGYSDKEIVALTRYASVHVVIMTRKNERKKLAAFRGLLE